LNYDPPMVILEYLVPSTGKLYHHKMKLRQLKAETPTNEVIEYLRKRHPLYFIANKISEEQITDLINRLKFKLKQMQGMMGGSSTTKETHQSKKEN
jgi:CEP19-like protein